MKNKKEETKETLTLDFEMDPVERLKKEIEFTNDDSQKRIGEFLLEEFSKDENIKNDYKERKVTLENIYNSIEFSKDENIKNDYKERKVTLENIYNSIVEVARKKANGLSCVSISDEEVFGLAIHFIHDGEIKNQNSSSYTLSKDEKKSLEEQAKEEYLAEQKRKLEDAENKRIQKEKAAKEKALEKEKKQREESGQMSLFDFGD